MGWGGEVPLIGTLGVILLAQFGEQFGPIELTIEVIHLGQFALQVGQIAFREAAHHVEFLEQPFALALAQLQNHVDALLLGVTYEAAGVHHGYLPSWVIAVVCHLVSAEFQLPHESLAIHKVLAASQRDDVYCVLSHCLLLSVGL